MNSNSLLANKINQSNSLKSIDGKAYDIAYEFCAKAHALVEIEFENFHEAGGSQNQIVLISSRLTPEAQQKFVNRQLANLSTFVREPAGSLLPYVWNEADEVWYRIDKTPDNDVSQTSKDQVKKTYGLFVAVSDKKMTGFILTDVPSNQDTHSVDAFQAVASRLIAKLIAVQPKPRSKFLSPREQLCLVWCASGKTSGEIGTILSLSEHTINNYFTSICSKLGACNRAHSVAKAIKWGMIGHEEIV